MPNWESGGSMLDANETVGRLPGEMTFEEVGSSGIGNLGSVELANLCSFSADSFNISPWPVACVLGDGDDRSSLGGLAGLLAPEGDLSVETLSVSPGAVT